MTTEQRKESVTKSLSQIAADLHAINLRQAAASMEHEDDSKNDLKAFADELYSALLEMREFSDRAGMAYCDSLLMLLSELKKKYHIEEED